MAYIYYNPNPEHKRTGDCVIRALSKALDCSWTDAYISLMAEGLSLYDMPSANYVWGMLLEKNNFVMHPISHECPDCTTVGSFAESHDNGVYVLATQNHAVCVMDGNVYDTWDSSGEVILYFYEKEI